MIEFSQYPAMGLSGLRLIAVSLLIKELQNGYVKV
jgi:hypothetical protein